jgi:hypothetical protein
LDVRWRLSARPTKLGQPFTRWSIRKLAAYLQKVHGRVIRTNPDRDAKLRAPALGREQLPLPELPFVGGLRLAQHPGWRGGPIRSEH